MCNIAVNSSVILLQLFVQLFDILSDLDAWTRTLTRAHWTRTLTKWTRTRTHWTRTWTPTKWTRLHHCII